MNIENNVKPYIKNETLVIPVNVDLKYKYWTKSGQSLIKTLIELNASEEMISRYSFKKHYELRDKRHF